MHLVQFLRPHSLWGMYFYVHERVIPASPCTLACDRSGTREQCTQKHFAFCLKALRLWAKVARSLLRLMTPLLSITIRQA